MRELFSIGTENSFVGALLISPEKYHDVSDVTPSMLVSDQTRTVYEAIQTLSENNQPIDVITIAEHISQVSPHLLDSIGGLEFIVKLHKQTPGSSNIKSYAVVISDKAKERKLYEAAVSIQNILMEDGLTTEERYQEAESVFTAASIADKQETSVMGISEALKDYVEFLDWRYNNEGIHGITTHITDLDKRLQGFKPGELYILAARPSMGKTTLAMNMVLAAIKDKHYCYISSLEMPRRQLMQRLMSAQGKIPLQMLKDASVFDNGDYATRIAPAAYALKMAQVVIDDQGGLDVNDLRSRCRKMKRKQGLDLIVVDYLQLLEDRTAKNRFDVVSSVSRKLKSLAKELECSVLALSQLSRKCEERPDKRPMLSDLRESGQIEQDADVIMFIYRDEIYHPEATHTQGVAEVITAKYRDGEIGTDYLAFIGAESRFADLSHEYTPPAEEPKGRKRKGFDL